MAAQWLADVRFSHLPNSGLARPRAPAAAAPSFPVAQGAFDDRASQSTQTPGEPRGAVDVESVDKRERTEPSSSENVGGRTRRSAGPNRLESGLEPKPGVRPLEIAARLQSRRCVARERAPCWGATAAKPLGLGRERARLARGSKSLPACAVEPVQDVCPAESKPVGLQALPAA